MTEHDLKTWPEPFEALLARFKWHEYRRNDRNYKVGDVLLLREWVPNDGGRYGRYTGRSVRRLVTYVGTGFGIPDGFCVMSLAELPLSRDEILAAMRRTREKIAVHHRDNPIGCACGGGQFCGLKGVIYDLDFEIERLERQEGRARRVTPA